MIEQSEDQPGDVEVEARLRRDVQMRPAPPFTADLQAVKRQGLRRRRRRQVLPAVVVLVVLGAGATAVGAGVLPGAQRQGTVTAVSAHEAGGDAAAGAGGIPAWCRGGSITYDYDGTGPGSPELAVQYLIDLSTAQDEHLKQQPELAQVDDALAKNSAVVTALQAVKEQATEMGVDRVRQDRSVVARDGSGEVIARAGLTEVQPGQWNVVTLSFSPPAVPECGR
jgi:hypothetical protein